MPGRYEKCFQYFCPPPSVRGGEAGESGVDKVRSALGHEYYKTLHYAIAHLRRADGGLRPKTEGAAGCSMNLLARGDTDRCL